MSRLRGGGRSSPGLRRAGRVVSVLVVWESATWMGIMEPGSRVRGIGLEGGFGFSKLDWVPGG